MDRRLISLSAQIRSNHISKKQAIKLISNTDYPDSQINDKEFITKKFSLSNHEMEKILKLKNKTFKDYKSYYPFFKRIRYVIKLLSRLKILPILYHDDKYKKLK